MGVVRYLCITIFLVFLAVSSSNAGNALTPGCNNKGREDLSGACLCISSFGGDHCEKEMNATCGASYEIFSPVPELDGNGDPIHKTANYPRLDVEVNMPNFTANTLTFSIKGPVVANRSYTDIKFVGSGLDASCSLGAQHSVWKLSSDEASCADRMALSLHWSNHSQCGFVKQPEPVWSDYHTFKATVVISYVDILGTVGEEDAVLAAERRSSASFQVYVNFQKFVEVKITEVVVYSQVNLSIALTGYLYNPDNMILSFEVTTFTPWPNMIRDDGEWYPEVTVPTDISPVASDGRELIFVPGQCDNTRGSVCMQLLWLNVTTKNVDDCDFNGEYIINVTIATCRRDEEGSQVQDCTHSWFQASWQVKESNICGEVTANPFVSGKLVAYVEPEHTTPATEFLLGDRGYFAVELDAKNDLNLTFTDIWAETEGDNGSVEKIYFYQNQAMVPTYLGQTNRNDPTNPSVVDLKLSTEAADVVVVNVNGVRLGAPHFDLKFDGYVFRPEVGKKREYIMHANGIITYLGNEDYPKQRSIKTRVVDFVWKADTAAMKSSMMFEVSAESEKAASPSAVSGSTQSLSSSVILPIAGMALVVVVGAIVVAVIIVKRKSSNAYRTFN